VKALAALAIAAAQPAPGEEPPPTGAGPEAEADPAQPPAPPVVLPSSPAAPARQGGRSSENAVREAEDAFGYSVGRESLGLYSAGNVRGFSPFAAGNVRIEGLYFDPYLSLLPRLRRSTSIRVGLSAQGYPFLSPTGIVDYAFRKPGDEPALAVLASGDSHGNAGMEFDATIPLAPTLSLGLGAQVAHEEFVSGAAGYWHNQAVALRWRPAPAVEVIPFWQRSEVGKGEVAPTYIPRGAHLPPRIERRRYDGPGWTHYDSIAGLQGVLATASPAPGWTVRGGLFRSLYDDRAAFAHLLTDLTPTGEARRLIIADPRSRFTSVSGELRASRAVTEGPRLHTFHLSYRGRDRRQRYAGSDAVDFGPARLGERFAPAKPDFDFGPQTRDVVTQSTYGIAYEGRWRGLGELGFAISKTDYRKRFELPGNAAVETVARPLVYNVSLAAEAGPRLVFYAGYARGLEESGIAPDQAVNRDQPLPAIVTRQVDGGLRYRLAESLDVSAGLFELRKPYFTLDAGDRFGPLGETRNRGAEFSLAGAVTPRLNVVAGVVVLEPRVTGIEDAQTPVGPRPVGLPARSAELNLDWRTPVEGLSLDAGISHDGAVPARVDNAVWIPARTIVNLGARYRFRIAGRDTTLRVQALNIGDVYGFALRGAGAYAPIAGRRVSAYLTIDL